MSSITLPARAEAHPHLRPLSVLRDLPAVADLIEMCFSNTMDSEGRRYVQDMRRAGNDNSFTRWASHAVESTSLPLSGYVWEESGKIVGNASLVPFKHHKERLYLIANIAVHPDHRRKGIARALTERAVQHAREKKVNNVWLHVRGDNPGAIDLYTQLGFVERARRMSWVATTDSRIPTLQADVSITRRNPNDWPLQLNWLSRFYPDPLAWHRKWDFSSLRPGFWNWLYLFFIDVNVRQWFAFNSAGTLQASLSWIPYGRGESLFAGTGERSDPAALTVLLQQARRDLYHLYPKIEMDFPSGESEDAIRAAGFTPQRTLLWMQATS